MATVPQFPAGTLSRSGLNTFVTEATTNITDANIAAGANIAISKTALGTYTAPTSLTASNTWQAVNVNPAIGDGTWSADYTQVGKSVTMRVDFTTGSTTTFGTGIWKFILPVAANAVGASCAIFIDRLGAGGQYIGMGYVSSTGFMVGVTVGGAATVYFDATHPYAFGNLDHIWFTLNYIAA